MQKGKDEELQVQYYAIIYKLGNIGIMIMGFSPGQLFGAVMLWFQVEMYARASTQTILCFFSFTTTTFFLFTPTPSSSHSKMSFTSYSRYEEHDGDGNSYSHSSIVVHELTDGETNALLANEHVSTPGLSPSMLQAPQPDYEIESGTSDAEYDSDFIFTDDDDSDDWDMDHWFPSLFRKSIIEYLEEDDEDAVMLDHPFDILSSNEVAEIEEAHDDKDDEQAIRSEGHPTTSSPRKRSKHRHHRHKRSHHHHDDNNEQEPTDDTPVPVVVHIVM